MLAVAIARPGAQQRWQLSGSQRHKSAMPAACAPAVGSAFANQTERHLAFTQGNNRLPGAQQAGQEVAAAASGRQLAVLWQGVIPMSRPILGAKGGMRLSGSEQAAEDSGGGVWQVAVKALSQIVGNTYRAGTYLSGAEEAAEDGGGVRQVAGGAHGGAGFPGYADAPHRRPRVHCP